MAKSDKFIQQALNPKHKGDLKAAASKAGTTTLEYARAHQHENSLKGRQSRFFLNVLSRVRPTKRDRAMRS
jgi:hypothetical protein